MKDYSMRGFIMISMLFCLVSVRAAELKVSEQEQDSQKTVVLENDQMKAVLVPNLARFPLSYVFKQTGHQMMKNPTALSVPSKGFQYYGGIVDCLPWVAGKTPDKKRLANKGLLYNKDWTWKIKPGADSAWFEGSIPVEYNDPVTGKKCNLKFEKKMTAFPGSSAIRMDHTIKNTGEGDARILFCNHARTCINGYDKGDYCFAPGNRCYIYYMNNNKVLEEKGVFPPCWTNWPLEEAVFLRPQKELRTVFAFIPASWCVAGDDNSKEALFFVGGPVKWAEKDEDKLKMGIFMTNEAYVLEPSISYSIVADGEQWENESLLLGPGQECTYTLYMIAYKDVTREDMPKIAEAYPECVVLDAVDAIDHDNKTHLTGRIACHAPSTLEIRRDGKTIASHELGIGNHELDKLPAFPTKADTTSIVLKTVCGERKLMSF